MKLTLTISRILVGVLFIFSGLIKANDPMGLSYKMQEFFDLWNMSRFNEYTLWLSVFMIALEIISGFALLIGWQMRFFSWLLLLMILFFTFLTGYAYLSGEFKNCGCFGDCIPITPLVSFIKDLLLMSLILLIFIFRKEIRPVFTKRKNILLMTLVTIFSFGIQFYVLRHLPFIDCLPYKKNNNITEKMKIPPGSVPDSFAIRFIYEKGGKKYEFDMTELPPDLETYILKERIDKLVRKGNADAPIKGFSLNTKQKEDSTEAILNAGHAGLLFSERLPVSNLTWTEDLKKLKETLTTKNIKLYLVTSDLSRGEAWLSKQPWTADITLFTADFTAIRTAARTNPTFILLKKGTIIGKWSYADFDEASDFVRKLH